MSRRGNQRKRERQQERFEQRKLEAQSSNPPALKARPISGELFELLQKPDPRSLAAIFAEQED